MLVVLPHLFPHHALVQDPLLSPRVASLSVDKANEIWSKMVKLNGVGAGVGNHPAAIDRIHYESAVYVPD